MRLEDIEVGDEVYIEMDSENVRILEKLEAGVKVEYGDGSINFRYPDRLAPVFEYGEEIEVSHKLAKWHKATYLSYQPKHEYPFIATMSTGTIDAWKYARKIRKEKNICPACGNEDCLFAEKESRR